MIRKSHGFTIVELLIVIVVIAILAAITTVAFRGIQNRASGSVAMSDIKTALRKLELYKAEFGSYPVTGFAVARTDQNCLQSPQYADWIPGVSNLPQSSSVSFYTGMRGCYIYASDGTQYILSAWGMMKDDMLGKEGYRLVGFRETDIGTSRPPFYICNHPGIGGSGNPDRDYYRHSYTITNIPVGTCA